MQRLMQYFFPAFCRYRLRTLFVVVSIAFAISGSSALYGQASDRISGNVNAAELVTLPNHHPQWANKENAAGPLPSGMPLEGLTLVLSRSPEQEEKLTGVSGRTARACFAELPSLAHTCRDGRTLRAFRARHRNAQPLAAVPGIACQLGLAKPHVHRVRRYSRRARARISYRAKYLPCAWRPARVPIFGSDDSASAGTGDQGRSWFVYGGGPTPPLVPVDAVDFTRPQHKQRRAFHYARRFRDDLWRRQHIRSDHRHRRTVAHRFQRF